MDYDMLGKIQYKCNEKNWYIEEVEYKSFIKELIDKYF